MRPLPVIASLLAVAALTLPALAQTTPPAARPHPAQQGPRNPDGQQGARLVRALRAAGVDEARIEQLRALHASYAERQAAAREQAREHRESLRALLAASSTDEAAYERALDGLERARDEVRRLRDAERSEARKILRPSEQAKVLAALHDQHAKGPRGRDGARPAGGRPAPDRAQGPRARPTRAPRQVVRDGGGRGGS